MSSSSTSPDQLPSLGDSWRRISEALSFSSVRVRGDTGTHLFHVGRYSSPCSAPAAAGGSSSTTPTASKRRGAARSPSSSCSWTRRRCPSPGARREPRPSTG
ncbi:hypothetical protein BAE44_0018727 [Dichanthelium oligosanthes]|uniref:Uncharacterized protein n=1 Tax=Dichanthelium oligosanthes TaxID=888268 RepID=A0A1E5V5J0_9POAL|nr:hypothetical protein BAE44_0018727 [Dichanthelium oligosanthes]